MKENVFYLWESLQIKQIIFAIKIEKRYGVFFGSMWAFFPQHKNFLSNETLSATIQRYERKKNILSFDVWNKLFFITKITNSEIEKRNLSACDFNWVRPILLVRKK